MLEWFLIKLKMFLAIETKFNAKDVIKVASIGTSRNTKLGNTVFTVGSPMGSTYAGTVTKGILSGKDRLIETQTSDNSESFIVNV